LKREEAIALLKKIAEEHILTLKWISLVKEDHGWEIHIKPESGSSAGLKPILEKQELILNEADEELIICRKHT
jgi:hypothetical protein